MKNRIALKALSAWLALGLVHAAPSVALDAFPEDSHKVAEFISAEGDFYIYQNGRPKFIVLLDGRTMTDLILSADRAKIVDFTLLDPDGNLISAFGITTHPELARTSLYSLNEALYKGRHGG